VIGIIQDNMMLFNAMESILLKFISLYFIVDFLISKYQYVR